MLTERNKGTNLDGSVEDLLSDHDHDHEGEGENIPLTSLYRIILPENASADLVSRTALLKDALTSATSTEARVLYESEGVAEISDTEGYRSNYYEAGGNARPAESEVKCRYEQLLEQYKKEVL